jgi:hypothetical protein
MEDNHSHLWYSRKAGDVKGPFPAGTIRRFVLLGRLTVDDQVSSDQTEWHHIRDLPELIPEEMRKLETEEDRQRLLAARLREDERLRDRRGGPNTSQAGRRRGKDRRKPEDPLIVAHREHREQLQREYTRKENNLWPGLWVSGILLALLAIGIYVYTALPTQRASTPECAAPPAPGVDWSNCQLEGVRAAGAKLTGARIDNANLSGANFRGADLDKSDLAYSNLSASDLSYCNLRDSNLVGVGLRHADLSHARLNNANLSYADLQGANLGGADLEGAKLDKAIWVDGSVCAPGSVGRCAH